MRKGPSRLRAIPTAAALLAIALVAPAAAQDTDRLVSLGVPMHGLRTIGGAVGTGADGRVWVYTVSSGRPGVFNVVDAKTGDVAQAFPLEGASDSYGVAIAPDGRVYVATTNTGRLYRYTPGSSSIEDLGRALPSETHLYRLAFDEQGRVYAGTYPNAHVVRYDPATGEFHDYGQVLAGMRYVRSVAIHGGVLYAGTQPEAHLVAVDLATGAKREIDLPLGDTPRASTLYDLTVVDDRLYARMSPTGVTGTLFVYDLASQTFKARFDGANGLEVSPRGPDGRVYFMKDGEVTGYDPATNALHPTGFRFLGTVTQFRGVEFVELNEPDFPGQTLVGMDWWGDVFWYSPATGATRRIASKIQQQPVNIRSLAAGSDGRIYTGGTGIGALGAYDPRTGAVESQRFAEVQGMGAFGRTLIIGAYPRARVYAYDASKPWSSEEYSPGPPGTPPNPNMLFHGDADQQDRPFAIERAGDKVAIGTVPRTGLLGGTLRIFDPTRGGEGTIHRDLVRDQSITALRHRDGILYAGTSVYGGYGSTPAASEARLFAFDVATGRKLWDLVPVPGDKTVSSLTWDRRGRLWGVTAGAIFRYDPRRQTTTWRRYADYSWPTEGAYVQAELAFNPADDRLYATLPGIGLVRVDPGTWEPKVLSDRDVYRLVVDRRGDVYVSEGPELLRYRPRR